MKSTVLALAVVGALSSPHPTYAASTYVGKPDATRHCYAGANIAIDRGERLDGKVCAKNPDRHYSNLVWK